MSYDEGMEAEDAAFVDDLSLCTYFKGWTLDYVRSLDELDRIRIVEALDGQTKALDHIRRRPIRQGQGNE